MPPSVATCPPVDHTLQCAPYSSDPDGVRMEVEQPDVIEMDHSSFQQSASHSREAGADITFNACNSPKSSGVPNQVTGDKGNESLSSSGESPHPGSAENLNKETLLKRSASELADICLQTNQELFAIQQLFNGYIEHLPRLTKLAESIGEFFQLNIKNGDLKLGDSNTQFWDINKYQYPFPSFAELSRLDVHLGENKSFFHAAQRWMVDNYSPQIQATDINIKGVPAQGTSRGSSGKHIAYFYAYFFMTPQCAREFVWDEKAYNLEKKRGKGQNVKGFLFSGSTRKQQAGEKRVPEKGLPNLLKLFEACCKPTFERLVQRAPSMQGEPEHMKEIYCKDYISKWRGVFNRKRRAVASGANRKTNGPRKRKSGGQVVEDTDENEDDNSDEDDEEYYEDDEVDEPVNLVEET